MTPFEEIRPAMSENPYVPPTGTGDRAPRRRWWLAGLILALGAALIAFVQISFAMDAAKQGIATRAAIGLTTLLLGTWLVFFAGLRWRTRLALVAAGALAVLGLVAALRIDGYSGDVELRLAWRWSPTADERLDPLAPAASHGAAPAVRLTAIAADDFPQFLGPNRNGIVKGVRLARDWARQPPKLVWRQPIGAGWSAFAVVGPFAVTQEQRGERELIVCYDLTSGKVLWSHADDERFGNRLELGGVGPRATPTIADGRVYSIGATGRLNCLEGADGTVVWTHDVLGEHHASNVQWGKSCSPAVIGDFVVVSAGGRDGHSLVAYHKGDGSLAWHAGDDPSSYSSPTFATLAGAPVILIVNHHSLLAHDPQDGHVLWHYEWEGGDKVPQPVAIDDERVLIGAGYGVGCTMLRIARGEGGAWNVRALWKQKRLKPKFTNLVVRDGYVYGLDDGRALVCLDLADGKVHWKGGRYGHGQVLLVDDLLLIEAESGEIALVETTPERYHEFTRFQAIDGKTWNNPVLKGPLLLVRNAEEAACYELPLEDRR